MPLKYTVLVIILALLQGGSYAETNDVNWRKVSEDFRLIDLDDATTRAFITGELGTPDCSLKLFLQLKYKIDCKESFSDIEKISGYHPVINEHPLYGGDIITAYNPDFLNWLAVTSRDLFSNEAIRALVSYYGSDDVYQRRIRDLYLTLQYLKLNPELFEKLTDNYSDEINSTGSVNIYKMFADIEIEKDHPLKQIQNFASGGTKILEISYWVRRKTGGNIDKFEELFQVFLKNIDPDFYHEVEEIITRRDPALQIN